jgi:hypothetical protein
MKCAAPIIISDGVDRYAREIIAADDPFGVHIPAFPAYGQEGEEVI